ncbi:MAG: hypothetical protein MN733_24930 [Nitrososphaera sp.]|nr:hypothetical protein [Nitrososphaera sp.]
MYKDSVLDELAQVSNVAQFVSFDPSFALKQRYSRVCNYPPNHVFQSAKEAVGLLVRSSPEQSVNVRSFHPDYPKSRDFCYGITNVDSVMSQLQRLAGDGLFTIVNETIDVNDGGVSGVVLGGVVEFAPGDTPRCVEKPGTLSLPIDLGKRLLTTVYNFSPSIDYPSDLRVEFSIHPIRRGFRHEHTIVWEMERVVPIHLTAEVRWPNRFSRLVGDKAFGLLVADLLHLPVPATTVISRAISPFRFGRPTGTGEMWIRTSPPEPVPGFFPTRFGWYDPLKLLAQKDPNGTLVASVLAQDAVDPVCSGASKVAEDGSPFIQGVYGIGDEFMKGRRPPDELPAEVTRSVRDLFEKGAATLGPVELEWVYDGKIAWVLQLHMGGSPISERTIFPGDADMYHPFDVRKGIDALRSLIEKVQGTQQGVLLVGNVGVTSHFGDLLRRARIPSRITPGDHP